MAISAVASIGIQLTGNGFPGNGNLWTATVTNAGGLPPGSFTTAAAFNSIPIPATATGVIIVPPNGSVITKTLKGVTGDTGIILAVANPTYLTFAAGAQATMGITASGIEVLQLFWT